MAIVVVAGVGCTTPGPIAPDQAEAAANVLRPAVSPSIPAARLATLGHLERAALKAIKRNHLVYPAKGSAVALLRQMLALQPDYPNAIRGMELVVEQYVELAMNAADQRRFAAARSMLARARLIDAQHPSIAPAAARVQVLQESRWRTLHLANFAEGSTKQDLRNFVQSETGRCRYLIAASSDAAGRAIYRIIRDAKAPARVRAQITISSSAKVDQICTD